MNEYQAPIDDIVRALRTAGLDEVLAQRQFDGIDLDAVRDVIDGFGTLAAEVIAPTDVIGDRVGATLDISTGRVTVPDEVARALTAYLTGGWTALAAATTDGSGGFPKAVGMAIHEMFGSANMALSLNPMLTQSAVGLLERWGDERQRRLYLGRLVDGTWTGTMNLTEPDAGSDLGALRAAATPRDDGRWEITGTKNFITWGEHDLTDNIVHLVLARASGAPAGTKGISLFIVPKLLVDDDGAVGARNSVRCLSIEHKLGIHASPTCVLEFDGALGELVGPLHGGMAAMFSMMNPARLAVGMQGVSIGERVRQQALAHASERRQGRGPKGDNPAPIIEHPDVKRMLVDISATVEAMRLVIDSTAIASDLAVHHDDAGQRLRAQRRVDVLTPVAKAWPTDQGVRVASIALQVHGGMGFIEETGVAQHLRDARIAPIYEGTNGVQAIDLVGRKVARDGGTAMGELVADLRADVAAAAPHAGLRSSADEVAATLDALDVATRWVVEIFEADRTSVLAAAAGYLELVGLAVGGSLLLRQATVDLATGDPHAARTVARVGFFASEHLSRRPTPAALAATGHHLDRALDIV